MAHNAWCMVQGITMAHCPPDDCKTIGFASGWRSDASRNTWGPGRAGRPAGPAAGAALMLVSVPWAHLLKHMVPDADAPEFIPAHFEPPPSIAATTA